MHCIYNYFAFIHVITIDLAESQKGIHGVQGCSVENQEGTTAIDFVQR